MIMNEAKVKEEILSCLNESSEENVVTKKPEENKNPGNGEWTFADWFGEDLTGKIYKGSLHFGHSARVTSLKGSPKEVEGDFDFWSARVTTLKGAPETVSGNFLCAHNELTSLEGAPKEVGGNFDCLENSLTSLKGGPKEVGGNFNCNTNRLTSLEGSPKVVGGDFNCRDNKLTSLEGGPQKVGGDFYCYNNRLTSLKGAPEEIGGDLYRLDRKNEKRSGAALKNPVFVRGDYKGDDPEYIQAVSLLVTLDLDGFLSESMADDFFDFARKNGLEEVGIEPCYFGHSHYGIGIQVEAQMLQGDFDDETEEFTENEDGENFDTQWDETDIDEALKTLTENYAKIKPWLDGRGLKLDTNECLIYLFADDLH